MFTVCPKCALTLVVTAADLRVAQGYVRCGRCSSVFNALAQLSDERAAARAAAGTGGAEPEEPEPERPGPEPGANAPAAPEPTREDALEFNPELTDPSSVFVAAPPNPQWTAAAGSFQALVAANQEPVTPGPDRGAANAGESLEVEIDAALLSDIVHPAPAPPAAAPRSRARAGAVPRERPQSPPPERNAAGKAPPANAAVTPAPAAEAPEPAEAPAAITVAGESAPPEAAAATRRPVLWTVGTALLALILGAQILNHQRDALATDPRFSRPLSALYAALGVQLAPRWDLRAYDVRQLGATVGQGSGGAITVRASIRNAGPRPQPLPLLRVTLQDRFGNRLASRDVQPRDYLPRGVAPAAMLGGDQRVDAELAFVDPGANAVGFELDACLPLSGGVACASDASPR